MNRYLKPNLLVLLGAWPLPNYRKTELIKRSYVLIINIVYFMGLICFAHDILYNISDTYLVSKSVVGTLSMIQNIIKNISFMIRRDFLRNTLIIIDELHENIPLSVTHAKIGNIMKKYQNRAHWWTEIIISLFSLVLLIILGYPLYLYWWTNKIEVFVITIFNHTDLSVCKFLLLYIVDTAIVCNDILIKIATVVLFTSCVLCICSCLDILNYNMKIATEEAIQEQRVTPLFGECIDYHNKILKLVKNIEILFSPLLFTQFIISSIGICLVTFILMQAEVDPGIKVLSLVYFFGIIIEMFVYCYFGELIQTKLCKLCVSYYTLLRRIIEDN